MENSKYHAKLLSIFFSVTSTMLLINLILTIITDPGHIPEGEEWALPPEEKEEEKSEGS